MHPAQHLAALALEAGRTAEVLRAGPLDAPVAGCPGWDVRRLALHTGGVHRWALSRVTGAAREPRSDPPDVAAWYADGAARLHAALALADPAAACPGFEGEATVGFWVRRMARETAVHRWDADAATGDPAPLDDALAADGLAEVRDVFAPRQVALGRAALPPYALRLTDGERSWRLDGDGPEVEVRGAAPDLLLLLWGRRPADDPRVAAVLAAGIVP